VKTSTYVLLDLDSLALQVGMACDWECIRDTLHTRRVRRSGCSNLVSIEYLSALTMRVDVLKSLLILCPLYTHPRRFMVPHVRAP
jgi:hypothetical protein